MEKTMYNFEEVLENIKDDITTNWFVCRSDESFIESDSEEINRDKSRYIEYIQHLLYHGFPKEGVAEYIKWILGMGYDIMDAGYDDIVAYAQHLGIDVPSLIKEIADTNKAS